MTLEEIQKEFSIKVVVEKNFTPRLVRPSDRAFVNVEDFGYDKIKLEKMTREQFEKLIQYPSLEESGFGR